MKTTIAMILGEILGLLLMGLAYAILRHSSRTWLR
jgi:hypothetical protein